MKKTQYEKLKKWRHSTKNRLLDAFGNKCGICGYNKSKRALCFHHLDLTEKDHNLSIISRSWEKTVIEARKCILLCSNCHMEVHDGITEIPQNIKRFDEEYADYRGVFKKDLFDSCPICGKPKSIVRITCSRQCTSKMLYKVDWDSIDLLSLYKEIGTYTGVGKKLGVSDNTIKKRIKILGSYNGNTSA